MANNQNITYGSYLVDKNGSPINSIASLAQAPVDYRMKVKVLADLTNSDTWLAQEAAGSGIAGVFNSVYYGLITYVAEDGDNNGLYVLQPPADTGSGVPSAAEAAKTAANWVRISQSDTKIKGLTTRLTAVENKASTNETAIGKKLDKDFVTSYTQGTIGEGTVFAARSDNTSAAQNVYITGAQIKNFAASAVTDKGTFATEAALKEAYPTPEDGWTATVLETGTTWVVEDGQWKDSGTASGVTSVNGKTGNVVLVAADIDDVYSDVETDAAIKAAIDTTTYATLTTDNKTVLGSINEIDGLVTTNTSNIAVNTSSIQGINSSISSIQSELALKQNATIDVTIQGEKETSITDALSSLDSALSAVKSTADGAAKVDASNVDADTWKGVLGFSTTSEVAGQITNAITTDTYVGLNTTNKTVQGAINEIQSSTSGLPGKVTALEKSVATNTGNITQLQTTVGEHTQSISNLQTSLASKQNTAISIEGITAKTVEGALTEFNSEIDTLTAGLAGKANTADVVLKTDISTSIPSAGAVDTKVASEKAVADSLAAKQNATDNSLTTTDKTIVGAINEIENKVLDSHLSKLPYGTLYFNNAKLFGSNFTIPNFPFSICATVRVDSWEGSTQGIQTIFQFGNNGTGALWGSICFNNVINNPTIQLRISKNTDGTISYSEVSYFFDKDTFLGKEHTIIGVCRELESTPVNFDIYVDGAKVATSHYKGLTLDSLSGTVNYAVNTYNANYSVQPASAHPMMLRNLYVFNFDVSAPAAPYSIADYEAGRLIPPALKPSQVSLALENYTIARNATTKLVKDASGNSNDATVQGSGTVAGDNDQSIKAFVDEIKTQTSLTSLQFNVYGTDKKIIPGKYMRLIFSQDINGNVTPTYVSEEEWNDVYDV